MLRKMMQNTSCKILFHQGDHHIFCVRQYSRYEAHFTAKMLHFKIYHLDNVISFFYSKFIRELISLMKNAKKLRLKGILSLSLNIPPKEVIYIYIFFSK